jgi:hypothetical protein
MDASMPSAAKTPRAAATIRSQRLPVRRCGGLAVGRVVSGGHGLIVTRNWNTHSASVATLGERKRIDLSD